MDTFDLLDQTTVRLLALGDADEFFRLVEKNRERLLVWCPWLHRVSTVDATRLFLQEKIDKCSVGNGFTAGIFHKERLAGSIALEYIDQPNLSTEIGYWLDADVEGRGIAVGACRRLIDHAFRDLGLERIQIRCAAHNFSSRKIPEKLGFTQEGVLRKCERLHDRTVDLVIYGLLREEWRG